jgi:nucleoside-diphosphate-sugar epimerase
VGLRLAQHLKSRYRVHGTCRSIERAEVLREAGVRPVFLDLDRDAALAVNLSARLVVHLVPPQATADKDLRTRRLMRVLNNVERMVYVSTSGVYGDCGGAVIDETRRVNPQSDRAQRRVDAEAFLRTRARSGGFRLSILRVPGIYARDRLPEERLRRGTPTLRREDDVFTNHIHTDDLVRAIEAALLRGRPMRTYHASDDCPLLTSDYFEEVARACGIALPERLPRDLMLQQLTPMQRSFMLESRRLSNRRLRAELGLELRYRSVMEALRDPLSDPRK